MVQEIVHNLRYGIYHTLQLKVPANELHVISVKSHPHEQRMLIELLRGQVLWLAARFNQELQDCMAGGWASDGGEELFQRFLSERCKPADREFLVQQVAVARLACMQELRKINSSNQIATAPSAQASAFDPWIFCVAWYQVCQNEWRAAAGSMPIWRPTALPLVSAVRDSYVVLALLAKEYASVNQVGAKRSE